MRKNKLYYKYLPLKKRRGALKYKIFKSVIKNGIGIVPVGNFKSVKINLDKKVWLIAKGKLFKIELTKNN